jgi:hypothetical protein
LQAAVRRQSEEAAEVEAFLLGLKLDRYVGLFLEHGFDCMEVVLEMQESHMREIGMATGHILKLRKRLAEMNPGAAARETSDGGRELGESRKRVSFGAAEEAPSSPARASGGGNAGTGTGGGGGHLMDGRFDEDESAASFQEALKAWRQGSSAPAAAAAAPATASASSPKKAAAPGSFWSSIGGAEVDLVRASTPTGPPPGGTATDTETQPDAAPGDDKLCCYQCYKQFFAMYAVERKNPLPEAQGDRPVRLCSEACAEKWVVAAQAKAETRRAAQDKLARMEERQRAVAEALAAAEGGASGEAGEENA